MEAVIRTPAQQGEKDEAPAAEAAAAAALRGKHAPHWQRGSLGAEPGEGVPGFSSSPSSSPPAGARGGGLGPSSSGADTRAPLIIGHYKLLHVLGYGAFGKVKLAEDIITGSKVAVKIIRKARIKSLDMMEKVHREIHVLRMCRHPHVIRLYDVIDTPSDIFVVMEYVSGGELFDFIVSKGRLHPDEARKLFQQLISGVEYCHYHRIVHRDLKPENLLLDARGNIKVADFGLSNWLRDGDFLRTSCGSPNYAAPEVISGNLYAGPEVDVWSCGVILYALLCGSLPFDDESIPMLFKKIKSGMYSLPSHLCHLARDIIPRMLIIDPMRRMTIPEIKAHMWFRVGLPAYLTLPPGEIEIVERQLDSEILRAVCYFKVKGQRIREEDVVGAIRRRNRRSDLRVAYELLLDRKRQRMRMEQLSKLRSKPQSSPTASANNRDLSSVSASATAVSVTESTTRTTIESSTNHASSSSQQEHHQSEQKPHQPPKGTQVVNGAGISHPAATKLHPSASESGPSAPTAPSSAHAAAPAHSSGIAVQPSSYRCRKWYLGIQSKKEAVHVMTEVYRALKLLGCDWRTLSSYRVHCRWFPSRKPPSISFPDSIPPASAPAGEALSSAGHAFHAFTVVENGVERRANSPPRSTSSTPRKGFPGKRTLRTKFVQDVPSMQSTGSSEEVGGSSPHKGLGGYRRPGSSFLNNPDYKVIARLSLYKVQSQIYLLDFQKIQGDPFSFMTLCSKIITQLKTLSAQSKMQSEMQMQLANRAKGQAVLNPHNSKQQDSAEVKPESSEARGAISAFHLSKQRKLS